MIQETREISVVVLGCLPSSQIILPKQWCEGDASSPYQEKNNEGIGQDLVDIGLLSFPGATLSQVRTSRLHTAPDPHLSCQVRKDVCF